MSTKTIYTRVKNKVDSLANWQSSTAPLLAGEIAIVRVATGSTYTNPVTGKNEPVVELLMKVGDGTTTFNNLPWLSAKASDVYNWAKKPTSGEVPVTITTGTDSSATQSTDTLGNWIKTLNDNATQALADASAVADKVDVEKVSTAIKNAIAELDSTVAGTGNFVKSVVQADGKVAVTYGNITEDDLPKISTSKIIVKAASDNTAEVTLTTKLTEIDSKIAEYDNAIKGGVHFVGEVSAPADLTNSLTTQKVIINGTEHTAVNGDIVIQGSKEFIWVSNTWKELGDLSRVGTLESWRSGLAVTDTAVSTKFVTAVNQADGKITVSRAQPTTSDIYYDAGNTLASFLAAHLEAYTKLSGKVDIADGSKVTTAIKNAIDALDVSDPTASGTATSFISTVKQTDGKITATKANLPEASSTTKGIVKLGEGGAAPYEVAAAVSAIESNYLRFNSDNNKLYLGETGAEEIIFDCGGAPV